MKTVQSHSKIVLVGELSLSKVAAEYGTEDTSVRRQQDGRPKYLSSLGPKSHDGDGHSHNIVQSHRESGNKEGKIKFKLNKKHVQEDQNVVHTSLLHQSQRCTQCDAVWQEEWAPALFLHAFHAFSALFPPLCCHRLAHDFHALSPNILSQPSKR